MNRSERAAAAQSTHTHPPPPHTAPHVPSRSVPELILKCDGEGALAMLSAMPRGDGGQYMLYE